jgi:hypothetical protein
VAGAARAARSTRRDSHGRWLWRLVGLLGRIHHVTPDATQCYTFTIASWRQVAFATNQFIAVITTKIAAPLMDSFRFSSKSVVANNRSFWPFVVLSFAGLALAQGQNPPPGYSPSGSVQEYFRGAWKLVSTENKYPDGRTSPYPFLGENGIGFLMYTASGHMCAQLMRPGRPRWANDPEPTAAEASSAVDGFVSYCGTFEIRESERTMIHRPETTLSPNWVGTVQRRPYHLVSQDRFFFRVEEKLKTRDGTEISVIRTITWERLK